jgi:hypothetical protein
MTLDEFLEKRIRKTDYLTEQDNQYIDITNGLARILMEYGSDEQIKDTVSKVHLYIDKYAYPAGLAQRIWAYDDAVEEAVIEYDENFSTRPGK